MALIRCRGCGGEVSSKAAACPRCGRPLSPLAPLPAAPASRWGFQWKSETTFLGWPLVHVAIGRDRATGRLLVARGVVAIGQFGLGAVTVAQFGLGLLFGLGQFVGAPLAIGQLALGLVFGLGQFATGLTAVGQIAFGKHVLAQAGFGEHVWSAKYRDPRAVEHFRRLLAALRGN